MVRFSICAVDDDIYYLKAENWSYNFKLILFFLMSSEQMYFHSVTTKNFGLYQFNMAVAVLLSSRPLTMLSLLSLHSPS